MLKKVEIILLAKHGGVEEINRFFALDGFYYMHLI